MNIQRFWSKVEMIPFHSCWEWTGDMNKAHGKNYGRFNMKKAHRISYELTYGKIPDGLFVLHKCDNPPCVRPEHLFLGTHLDNMRDKVLKGRDHNKSKTHCVNGHPYFGDNLIIKKSGERRCRECHNSQLKSLRRRQEVKNGSANH